MKKSVISLALVIFVSFTHAQTLYDYLKERANDNLTYLVKDPSVRSTVDIDESGIHLKKYSTNAKDLSIYWKEIPHVINLLEGASYYDLINKFKHKNTQIFQNAQSYQGELQHYTNYPESYEGLYVALDPGHFGGNIEEAQLEARVVKMKGEDIGKQNDIMFFEADLAYTTAWQLKEYLESKGAVVLLTRPYGAGAKGMNFATWLKSKDGFQSDVLSSMNNGDITSAYSKELQSYYQDTVKFVNRNKLFDFYKFLDFRERIHKINEFHPDITISIHYNASENNKFFGDRYLRPVTENYNFVFIPGAFMHGELDRIDKKLDFVRLLLSPDLTNSMRLADLVLDEHEKILKVGRGNVFPGDKMDRVSNSTPFDGVLCRNLAITRMVRGTVIYGESLLQDNLDEAIALADRSLTIYDPAYGNIKTSKRTKEVAQAYANAIDRFLAENKGKQEHLRSLQASSK